MSSFRYLRIFFLFFMSNTQPEQVRVLWIVLPFNRSAAVHQGSCSNTCCVQGMEKGQAVH